MIDCTMQAQSQPRWREMASLWRILLVLCSSSTTPITCHIQHPAKGGHARQDLVINFLCVIVLLTLPL